MKLSKHSKIRLRERTNLNHKERRSIFRDALTHGKTFNQIKDEKTKDFMKRKGTNCKVKLYKGYLFFYSKNSHQLYTMYKLPNLEEEKENE